MEAQLEDLVAPPLGPRPIFSLAKSLGKKRDLGFQHELQYRRACV